MKTKLNINKNKCKQVTIISLFVVTYFIVGQVMSWLGAKVWNRYAD